MRLRHSTVLPSRPPEECCLSLPSPLLRVSELRVSDHAILENPCSNGVFSDLLVIRMF